MIKLFSAPGTWRNRLECIIFSSKRDELTLVSTPSFATAFDFRFCLHPSGLCLIIQWADALANRCSTRRGAGDAETGRKHYLGRKFMFAFHYFI